MMQRYEVINTLIKRHGYRSYLELGTQGDVCLSHVECEYKVGVDPDPVHHDKENSDAFYEMDSDTFFVQNDEEFDIIFVDGLHEDFQVRRDIRNALKCISKEGAIVVHDCNPQKEINQMYPMPHIGTWNGTVWRAWVVYRRRPRLKMYVVDTDEGCGVIMDGRQEPLRPKQITFDEFKENRKEWLNLISVEEFLNE